jgi:membrane-associated phospholipid phosphatase
MRGRDHTRAGAAPGTGLFLAAGILLSISGSVLAFAAHMAGPLPGDLALSQPLREAEPGKLVNLFLVRTGDVIWSLPPLAVLILLLMRRWADTIFLSLAASTGMMFGEGIKALVARPRPALDALGAAGPPEGYGFLSVTALFSVVFLGTICYLVWQARPSRPVAFFVFTASFLLVLATGISRVYAGEHWPTDVLGGWLLGGAWSLVLVAAHLWCSSRWMAEAGDPTRRRRRAPR